MEKAIDSVMLESYLYGVSTRNVKHVVESLGLKNVSASYGASLASELDVKTKEFLKKYKSRI